MTETIFQKNVYWLFILVHVPSTRDIKESGFMTYTASQPPGGDWGAGVEQVVH